MITPLGASTAFVMAVFVGCVVYILHRGDHGLHHVRDGRNARGVCALCVRVFL